MATAIVKPIQSIKLVIKLSPEEAERLKELFRLPLMNDEAQAIKNIRCAIWDALDDADVASI